MVEFNSWRSYWDFEHATMEERRYIRGPDVEEFLKAVAATAKERVEVIPAQGILWRAQLGYCWRAGDEYRPGEPVPYGTDRMKPRKNRGFEGRVNPKGITYLYLATNRDTALAEVRPWIGSLISVGQFKMCRELRVVNCTTNDKIPIYLEGEPSAAERERSVWTYIDRAFAEPVMRTDDVAKYVPTQILAELFKAEGFDGLGYRSSLGPGHNIGLFDLDAVDVIADSLKLFEVKALNYKFEQHG